MSETHPCKGKTSKGDCECANYVKDVTLQGIWQVCVVCSHTAQIHGVVVSATAYKVVSTPKPAAAPISAEKSTSVVCDFTPKAMRAWLKANGHAVGERGRLSPAQQAAALAGLSAS